MPKSKATKVQGVQDAITRNEYANDLLTLINEMDVAKTTIALGRAMRLHADRTASEAKECQHEEVEMADQMNTAFSDDDRNRAKGGKVEGVRKNKENKGKDKKGKDKKGKGKSANDDDEE